MLRKSLLNIRALLSVLMLLALSLEESAGQAKVSSAQALQFYKEAKAKGMSDADIEKMALANGLTPSDLVQLRQEMAATLSDQVVDDHAREANSLREVNVINPETRQVAEKDTIPLSNQIFGQSFFSDRVISFEPNLQIPTPINYIVGPGDEILVDISGNAVNSYRLRVSPEGTVNLANFPPFYVSGLPMEEAQKRIISRLKTAYSGPGIHTNITLGKIRSIAITVTGEVRNPGTYTVPSLATAFHALYVSGGPTAKGTMREIEIIRNNRLLKKIDFYKFLINGDVSDNIMLTDQDIILVRPSKLLVSVQGEVKTPGIFEMTENESLEKAIFFAGGFTSEAYSHSVSYHRNTGREYELGQVLNENYGSFQAKNGDRFTIGKILNRFVNRVTVRGAVYREGEYPMNAQLKTVSDLVKAADGVRENAFLHRAVLYRLNEVLEPVVIPVDLKKLLKGEVADIELRRDDLLEIKTVQELREEGTVSVFGEIATPGDYAFREGLTVGDVIFEAGGYTFGAIPFRIEVSRRIKSDTLNLPAAQNVKIYHLNLADNLKLTEEELKFRLEPFDHIFIRKSPRYETQKTFTVLGQVSFPGNYTVKQSVERISDAITRAGGLKDGAYLNAAQFRRRGAPIALDLNSIMNKPDQAANLLLQQGDTLLIPERQETVSIIGAVLNPSVMNYDKNYNVKDYLIQAGGFVENANRRNLFVTHANGITDRTRRFLFFRSYPKVEPGSQVIVPLKEVDTNRQPWSRGERVMLISSVATISVTLIRVLQEVWVNNKIN